MTADELKAIAAEQNANPYYLAYALATGASSCKEAFDRDGGNHLFMFWNNDVWSEQARLEKTTREWVSTGSGAVDRHIALCASKIP